MTVPVTLAQLMGPPTSTQAFEKWNIVGERTVVGDNTDRSSSVTIRLSDQKDSKTFLLRLSL